MAHTDTVNSLMDQTNEQTNILVRRSLRTGCSLHTGYDLLSAQFANWLHFSYWLVLPLPMCSLRVIPQNIDNYNPLTVAQYREGLA
jgi:hypothetical protein